jgi:hypothetical protein
MSHRYSGPDCHERDWQSHILGRRRLLRCAVNRDAGRRRRGYIHR